LLWLYGPEEFWGFRETGPWSLDLAFTCWNSVKKIGCTHCYFSLFLNWIVPEKCSFEYYLLKLTKLMKGTDKIKIIQKMSTVGGGVGILVRNV